VWACNIVYIFGKEWDVNLNLMTVQIQYYYLLRKHYTSWFSKNDSASLDLCTIKSPFIITADSHHHPPQLPSWPFYYHPPPDNILYPIFTTLTRLFTTVFIGNFSFTQSFTPKLLLTSIKLDRLLLVPFPPYLILDPQALPGSVVANWSQLNILNYSYWVKYRSTDYVSFATCCRCPSGIV